MQIEYVKKTVPETDYGKNSKPVVIRWKGVNMMRAHSMRAAAYDIVQAITNSDLISVDIIGKQGTGKTSVAEAMGHLVHTMTDIPFKVNKFGKDELLNLKETVKTLTPTNQIIIFDDMSFLGASATKKQLDSVNDVLSTIRHLEGGKDVKILIFKNFHYTKAVNPFLRQSDFSLVSSVDPNEVKNLNELLGGHSHIIDELQGLRQEALLKKTFTIILGKKNKFIYDAKKPFLPYIYTNGRSVRIIVSPLREWIDPICSICSTAMHQKSLIDVNQFKEEFDASYGKTALYAVKQMLKEQGITTYGKNYVSCRRYLDKALELKRFNLEDLAVVYGLKPTVTKLRKKPDGVLVE